MNDIFLSGAISDEKFKNVQTANCTQHFKI